MQALVQVFQMTARKSGRFYLRAQGLSETGHFVFTDLLDAHATARQTSFEDFTDFLPMELDEIEALMGEEGVLQKVPSTPAWR